MSEATSTEPQLRLRSPFNGEAWPVPPEVTPEMLEALLKAGFTKIPPKGPRKDDRV